MSLGRVRFDGVAPLWAVDAPAGDYTPDAVDCYIARLVEAMNRGLFALDNSEAAILPRSEQVH